MANIKGEGGATAREILVSTKLPTDSKIKPGVHKMNSKAIQNEIIHSNKSVLVNAQLNNIGLSPDKADQNPYFFTEKTTRKDGKPGYNHCIFYDNKEKQDGQMTQLQEMLSQCDKCSVENGYATFAIKADIGMRGDGKQGLYVKTKSVQKSDQPVTATLASDQFNATLEAKKYAKEHSVESKQSDAVQKAEATAERAEEKVTSAEASVEEPQA